MYESIDDPDLSFHPAKEEDCSSGEQEHGIEKSGEDFEGREGIKEGGSRFGRGLR